MLMVKFPKADIARKDCRFASFLFVFCRKKNAVYRQKCTPICPSKSKHSKSEAILMLCVLIDLCKKLYLFRTVTLKHGIVYNKNIGTVFRIQWKNSGVYDSGCKHCSKTHPVNLNNLNETIHGIFCKIRCVFSCKQTHIHTSVGENQHCEKC